MRLFILFIALSFSLQTLSQSTPIFFASFDENFLSEEGEEPYEISGVSLQASSFGQAAEIMAGDILQYPIANNIDPEQGSLSMWLRPYWNQNGIFHRFFVLGDNPRNFEIHHDEGANFAFAVNTWNQNNQTIRVAFADGQGFTADTWHHLVYTWNSERISIYLNGVEIAETEVGYPIPAVNESAFHVGSLFGDDAFNGLIDELAIYGQSLDPEEIQALHYSYLDNLEEGNALKIVNKFEEEVTQSGITLVDWEGPIRNPAMEYFLQGTEDLTYPLTVQLRTQMPEAYFNLPSTTSNGLATKSLVINGLEELTGFYMSIFMDEDGIGEEFDLELVYPINGVLHTQVIPVRIIDQDYERPLSYPVIIDFSAAMHPFFQDDKVQAIIREAAEDWLYYVDGTDMDTYPARNNSQFIQPIGAPDFIQVFNQVAFNGFYLYVFGTNITAPCICSTGYPTLESNKDLQTAGGEIVPIPRFGVHALNVLGNFNEEGYVLSRPYEDWTMEDHGLRSDLYSLSKHEIGHAIIFEYLPRYNDFIAQNLITSPAIANYYPGGGVVLYDDSELHLIDAMDPESLSVPFASSTHQVPVGRDMLTKLDVLIMEAVGYPLRENEVTRPLSVTLNAEPAVFGQEYSAALLGSGGVPIYRFTLVSGELPAGITFDGVNLFSGSPQETGLFPLNILVEDYSNNEDSAIVEVLFHVLRREAELIDISIENQVAAPLIDRENREVVLMVEEGADLNNLVPNLTISPGASLSPASGMAQDFTSPVVYTITSEDGEVTQTWTVTVVIILSSFNADLVNNFAVYPNPFSNSQTIDLQLEHPQVIQIYLTDTQGRKIWHRNYGKLSALSETYQFTNLTPGMYKLYVMGTNGLLAIEQIVKVE